MEQPLDINATEHAVGVLQSLDAMRRANKDCDVIIKVGKEEIPAHRNVVRAQSDYFDAMFTHDTLENQTGVVEIKGMKFKPVKKCVDFFYTGKISTSEEGCEDLLHAASLMQVTPVCEKIAPFLESRLNPRSFFNIKKIATKYDLESLNEVCDEYALGNLEHITKEHDFNHLDSEYVLFLIASEKSGHPDSEDSKLAIAVQWIKTDVQNRQQHLNEMVKALDLARVSRGTVRYLIENEPLFNQSPEILKTFLLSGIKSLNIDPKPLRVSFSTSTEPNAIIVFDMSSKALQAYFPETNTWKLMHQLLDEMCQNVAYTAAVSGKFLYVFLENQKIHRIAILEKNSQWVQMKSTKKSHGEGLRSATHDGAIYVGGNSAMERYIEKEDQWEVVDLKGVHCNNSELVTYGDFIYCIGGRESEVLKDVARFSPSSSSWTSVKPMQIGRNVGAATILGSSLYVAGGYGTTHSMEAECYDTCTDSWKRLPPMTKPHSCYGLHAVDNRLYAVGHYENPCIIEMFDFQVKQWKIVVESPTMKIMARATVSMYIP